MIFRTRSTFYQLRKMCSNESSCLPVGQLSSSNNESDYKLIKEGSAEIEVPKGNKVFYNPVQEFNRDLSVSVLQVVTQEYFEKKPEGKNFRILEALSATGLRSIRYAKEIPNVSEVIANDISRSAIEIVDRNIILNGVENIVKSSNFDAIEVMFNSRHPSKQFQAVDLDPFGCPSQFLDTAVQCVEDGGVLLVTCTDMAVLCGNSPETCFVKYGSISMKNNARHEMALRIALHCIQSQAAKYRRYIVPLLSFSVDFYIRIIVKIFTSACKCKENTSKLAMVYSCSRCDSTYLQPLGQVKIRSESQKNNLVYSLPAAPVVDKDCRHCGGKHYMGGPIWSAPIHDLGFVGKVVNAVQMGNLASRERLLGLLNVILEELWDIPLYYNLPKLCSKVKTLVIPMMMFRSAVLNGGYRISYSHACKESFKTDAPINFIWDVIREWVKDNPVSEKYEKDCTVENILSKSMEYKIDLSLRPDANPLSRKNRLLRFPPNPAPCWGPGTKSSSTLERPEKSIRNQNKKKRKALEAPENSIAKKIAPEEMNTSS